MAVLLKKLLFPLLLFSFILADQAQIVEADLALPGGKDDKPAPDDLNFELWSSVKRRAAVSALFRESTDCGGLCGARCSQHSRPNLCMRACGTCCFRCKCVPPGTSGNRELCGACYTDMTTHGNRTKCP